MDRRRNSKPVDDGGKDREEVPRSALGMTEGLACWLVTTLVKVVVWVMSKSASDVGLCAKLWVRSSTSFATSSPAYGMSSSRSFTLDWRRIADDHPDLAGFIDSLFTVYVLFLSNTLDYIITGNPARAARTYVRTNLVQVFPARNSRIL